MARDDVRAADIAGQFFRRDDPLHDRLVREIAATLAEAERERDELRKTLAHEATRDDYFALLMERNDMLNEESRHRAERDAARRDAEAAREALVEIAKRPCTRAYTPDGRHVCGDDVPPCAAKIARAALDTLGGGDG